MFNGDITSSVQNHQFKRIPGTKKQDRDLFGPIMPDELGEGVEDVFVPQHGGFRGTLESFYYHDYSSIPPLSGLLHDGVGVLAAGLLGYRGFRSLRPLVLATTIAFFPEAMNWVNGYLESSQVPFQLGMDAGKVVIGYSLGRVVSSRRFVRRTENESISYDTSSEGRAWWRPIGRRK